MSTFTSRNSNVNCNRLSIYVIIYSCYALIFHPCNVAYGQQFNWGWASQVHGNYNDEIQKVSTNAKGEMLVSGAFFSSAIQWGDTMLINPYENDAVGVYFGKVNTQGELKWANKIFCAPGYWETDLFFRDADINNFGESFVAGHITYYGIMVDTLILNVDGGDNSNSGFAARFDANGKITWAHIYEDGCDVANIIADNYGGFYITGTLRYYAQVDFGDTILYNPLTETQAYIAHYNSNNVVDWAKLIQGKVNEIHGQSIKNDEILIYGDYESYVDVNQLTIDDFSITCMSETANCSFWGKLNIMGEVQWLHNVADEPITVYNRFEVQDGYKQFISFDRPYITVLGDTVYSDAEYYYTNRMLSFDRNGFFLGADIMPQQIGNAASQLYIAPTGNWYATLNLIDSVSCGENIIYNTSIKSDPVVLELDDAFNAIDCYHQELEYSSHSPVINWDRFGNKVMTGSFSGDTLQFGPDVLTNLQLQFQYDAYIAYENRCDTVLSSLTLQDNVLKAPDGVAWTWYVNDSLMMEQTGQVILPLYSGYYTASATQADGCVKWTKPIWFDSVNEPGQIFIYPNPSSGNCTILLPEVITYCNIYNISGQLVYTCLPNTKITLELSNLASGTYFIKSGNEQHVFSSKFIIL
ncbi:MAG: T9SS type A sorting domain-containing protein [Chitinophagales bacterium]